MDNLLGKTISAAIIGVILYLWWWHIRPFLSKKKANFITKSENSLEKHGLLHHYKVTHKVIKIVLYIILALMLLPFILIFLLGILGSK